MHQTVVSLYEGRRPSIDEFVDELQNIFPLLGSLKDTIQDPIWHAEGDVHIHTGMVIDEIYKIIDQHDELTQDERVSLILAALLHDIAKPLTTTKAFSERDNRVAVKASKHETIGRDYLSIRLLDLGLPTNVYYDVISLVAYHQEPKMLVVKNKSRSDYIKHMQKVNYKLVYLLEIADMKGRICEDLDDQIEYLEEYKMMCDDYHFESGNSYNDVIGTYLISVGELYSLDEAEHKLWAHKNHSVVTVMCGIPGSGKSSSIPKGSRVISLDEIRREIGDFTYKKTSQVLLIATDRLRECLRKKQDVVYDATNYRSDFRKKIFDLCHAYHAQVNLHLILKPLSHCIRDNNSRPFNARVETDYIIKQFERFEFPTYGEYHTLNLTLVTE